MEGRVKAEGTEPGNTVWRWREPRIATDTDLACRAAHIRGSSHTQAAKISTSMQGAHARVLGPPEETRSDLSLRSQVFLPSCY